MRVTTSGSDRVPMPGDVGQVAQAGEGAAPEVEHVDLHLTRGMRQSQAGDDGSQERRLAGARRAHDGDVTGGPGQVGLQDLALLLAGHVDGAEGEAQRATRAPGARDEPEVGVDGEVGQQLVEGVGHVEGR